MTELELWLICFRKPNQLTISQTNWNKPGLFGKLVLWNSPLKTLISLFRCVWLGLKLNSPGKWTWRTYTAASHQGQSKCFDLPFSGSFSHLVHYSFNSVHKTYYSNTEMQQTGKDCRISGAIFKSLKLHDTAMQASKTLFSIHLWLKSVKCSLYWIEDD